MKTTIPARTVYDVIHPKVDVLKEGMEPLTFYPGEDKGDIVQLTITLRKPDGTKATMANAIFAIRSTNRQGLDCYQGELFFEDGPTFEMPHPGSITKIRIIPRDIPEGWFYSASFTAKRI